VFLIGGIFMSVGCSDEQIEKTVKAFKTFIKRCITNSAIDYKRKMSKQGIIEIVYSDLIDEKVSLSIFDDDAFFVAKNDVRDAMKNIGYKKELTEKEEKVLSLVLEGLSIKDIAKELRTTDNSVSIVLYKLRRKVKGDGKNGK